MTPILKRGLAFALLAATGGMASAHPFTLSVSSGSASIASTSFGSGAWTVEVVVTAGSPAVFTLSTDTNNTVVEKIEVECDADCRMTVNQSGGGTFSEIRNIVERSTSSPESFQIDTIQISGTLGDYTFGAPDTGLVAAEEIRQIVVGGDLHAVIVAGPRADSSDSDIELIDVAGDLHAERTVTQHHITALSGSIGRIIVDGELIGRVFAFGVFPFTTYQPMLILARDGIREVEADLIDSTGLVAHYSLGAPATGSLSRIETRTGGMVGLCWISGYAIEDNVSVPNPGVFVSGDFEGLMAFSTALTFPIDIDGDLVGNIVVGDGGLDHASGSSGDITIHGNFEEGLINLAGNQGFVRTLVRIGGNYGGPQEADALITVKGLADGGEIGQIIIGANGSGGWLDPVVVDGNTLSPQPDYDDEDLVGAVGQVEFDLHDLDCIPEHGDPAAALAYTVTLAFYGRVTWNSGFPFTVEYSTDSGSTWTSDNANWTVLAGKGTRMVQLMYFDYSEPSYIPADRDYRIRPITTGSSKLLCDDLLTSSDVLVEYFTYSFYTP